MNETPAYDVRVGDVWRMENHRLVCGDAADPAVVSALLGDEKADVIFTDPPYGLKRFNSSRSMGARTNTRKNQGLVDILNDNLQGDDLLGFLRATIEPYPLREGGHLFLCYNWRIQGIAERLIDSLDGIVPKGVIVWNKKSPGLCNPKAPRFRSQHEWIFWATKGDAYRWRGGRGERDVWDISRPRTHPAGHPTPKPVSLVTKAISSTCPEGGIVIDMFAGTGATLYSCVELDLSARLVELHPGYCSYMLEEWERLTGWKPELVERDGMNLEGTYEDVIQALDDNLSGGNPSVYPITGHLLRGLDIPASATASEVAL